ncbi:MAG TPA: hypothetical protein VK203_06105 [Nostocaceae cyanobacterium]|nr:hypothetical protein [Nostocaceae cyanobacterium]
MSEPTANTTNNGNKTTSSRGQNVEINPAKTQKQQRILQSLPAAVSMADMSQVQYAARVSKIAVEYKSLENYDLFSLSPDGSEPYMKVSRSKVVKLSDKKVLSSVSSGNCYRINLSSLPIITQQA